MGRLCVSDGDAPCMKSLQPKVLSASKGPGGVNTAGRHGIISVWKIKVACASGFSGPGFIAIWHKEPQRQLGFCMARLREIQRV
jgi:hypothetical protein